MKLKNMLPKNYGTINTNNTNSDLTFYGHTHTHTYGIGGFVGEQGKYPQYQLVDTRDQQINLLQQELQTAQMKIAELERQLEEEQEKMIEI